MLPGGREGKIALPDIVTCRRVVLFYASAVPDPGKSKPQAGETVQVEVNFRETIFPRQLYFNWFSIGDVPGGKMLLFAFDQNGGSQEIVSVYLTREGLESIKLGFPIWIQVSSDLWNRLG
jgi:hypothetical protein